MYRILFRPFLFLIPPETIHRAVVMLIKLCCSIPGFSYLLTGIFSLRNIHLRSEFAGIELYSPVGLAAGFDKNGEIYNEFSGFGFGFIEIGTVTPVGQPGNPKPRSFRLKKDNALINRMGFNNIGVDAVVENLKKSRRKGLIIGGNIGKNSATPNNKAADDYELCFRKLYDYVDYFVVNVSCPNISNLSELQDSDALGKILERLVACRREQKKKKPILLKISPDLNFSQIDEILKIYYQTGIEGIVATNTTIQRSNLHTDKKTILATGNGGLSGKPLTMRSTEIIRYITEKAEKPIPIIGVGGIMSPEDAIDKIAAGASLVQIYTGFIYEGPCLARRINRAILKRRLM